MALITKPATMNKGEEYTLTLSKTDLFALPEVAADAYFSAEANVAYCVIEYNSDPGNQKQILKFDLSEVEPTAKFKTTATARDSFLLKKIILVDNDSGTMSLQTVPSGNDISLAGSGGGGGDNVISPEAISDIAIWLDASTLTLSDGGAVSSWADKRGNGIQANVVGSGVTYAVSAVSGKPSVYLDGNFSYLKTTTNISLGYQTVFVVGKFSATNYRSFKVMHGNTETSWQQWFAFCGDNPQGTYKRGFSSDHYAVVDNTNAWAGTSEGIFTMRYNGSFTIKKNGTEKTITSQYSGYGDPAQSQPNTPLGDPYFVGYGGPGGYSSIGNFAEVIVFNRALTDQEIGQVEAYLAAKYSI